MIAKNQPEPEKAPGGQGGNLSTQPGQTSDTRLITRAIREQWPIPAEKRGALIRRQIKIALSKETSPREAVQAFRGILSANAQNMEQEARDNPQAIRHEHSGVVGHVVKVVETDGWYGNNAHDLAAESTAASDTDADPSGPLQGGRVRKALGENGSGTNGHG